MVAWFLPLAAIAAPLVAGMLGDKKTEGGEGTSGGMSDGAMASIMGLGMISQGMFGMMATNREAQAAENITQTRATAATSIAGINANASIENTRWQIMGLILASNSQHNQAVLQMEYADRMDRRQAMLRRRELSDRRDMATLQVNAQLVAGSQAHVERMAELKNEHEEKMFEHSGRQIDLGSLLNAG